MPIWLYLLCVISCVAVPLAFFEGWMMRHYHVEWGEELPKEVAFFRPISEDVPLNIVDRRLWTWYHLTVFLVKMPILLSIIAYFSRGFAARPPRGTAAWIFFVAAGTVGVMVFEDILFFIFSEILRSPYPHALRRLLRGEADWHPRYFDLLVIEGGKVKGSVTLPDFYLWGPLLITAMLFLEEWASIHQRIASVLMKEVAVAAGATWLIVAMLAVLRGRKFPIWKTSGIIFAAMIGGIIAHYTVWPLLRHLVH